MTEYWLSTQEIHSCHVWRTLTYEVSTDAFHIYDRPKTRRQDDWWSFDQSRYWAIKRFHAMTPGNELKRINNFARRVWRVREHVNYSIGFWYVRITCGHDENKKIEGNMIAVTHSVVIDTAFCVVTSDPDRRLHEHEITFDSVRWDSDQSSPDDWRIEVWNFKSQLSDREYWKWKGLNDRVTMQTMIRTRFKKMDTDGRRTTVILSRDRTLPNRSITKDYYTNSKFHHHVSDDSQRSVK